MDLPEDTYKGIGWNAYMKIVKYRLQLFTKYNEFLDEYEDKCQ